MAIFISHASADDDFVAELRQELEELVLTLTDPRIETEEGKRRAAAMATLEYTPADPGARGGAISRQFSFTAPLGPIETADLRWYLENYSLWPIGVFRDRADGIEQKLPGWGRDLFQAALGEESAREALSAWQNAAPGAGRRFSVQVEKELPEDASKETRKAAAEAASELLALPWELLHDGDAWLFQGNQAVRVRRRLPSRHAQPSRPTALPLRILLVSPRPEKDSKGSPIAYIDHRISVRPMTEVVESLGALARLTLLNPPTCEALEQALQEAADRGEPFDVLHFDGHGVYNPRIGLGGLCFEDPNDAENPDERALDFVDAVHLAGLVCRHRLPLVFLEARQTVASEVSPIASVAARMLEEGVTSVVAMSHSVLAETARRFVQAFYAELADGARVGRAMLAGQRALFADPGRGGTPGAGELQLQDWFVPVLYQERQDPQLVTPIPPEQAQQLEGTKREMSLGDLPEPPHGFKGRSRELLALERLLQVEPYAVVRGAGGQGRTTLAAELARWLVRTGRFTRAAFVSLEHHRDERAVLDALNRQLLPEGGEPALLVLDNCESILPGRAAPSSGDVSTAIFTLCQRLLKANPGTRIVFITREPLPKPFDSRWQVLELGALIQVDAIELIGEVMQRNGWKPPENDAGTTLQEITDLVEAVHRHARALVLLAREVARSGVRTTTVELQKLTAGLEHKRPGDENALSASVELFLRQRSRDEAVGKGELGLVRLRERRYREALDIYTEARDTFEASGEPLGVATAWHQMGRVYEEMGQLELAEHAYGQALALKVRENDLAGQASTLDQLGLIHRMSRRPEESVKLHGQAAQLSARFGDLAAEGRSRSNLALALAELQRHDEARQELQRAIECDRPFGQTAEPWKTWAILETLERATGHAEAAQAARQQAIETYLAYRREGGISHSPIAQLYRLVAAAIRDDAAEETSEDLDQIAARPDTQPFLKTLIPRLQAILAGNRDPALAADPELDWDDAAELQLLLGSLRAGA